MSHCVCACTGVDTDAIETAEFKARLKAQKEEAKRIKRVRACVSMHNLMSAHACIYQTQYLSAYVFEYSDFKDDRTTMRVSFLC